MRVLIVSPYRTVAPHFEHELELAQRHLDRGDQVTFLSCLGELAICDFNPGKDASVCRDCRLRRNHGLQQLTVKVAQQDFTEPSPPGGELNPAVLETRCVENLEELKSLRTANLDLGFAVLSSLVSQVRDPELQVSDFRQELQDYSTAALQVYRGVLRRLQEDRPQRVYVFNGRFASMRAVLRACQVSGVECLIHERGCDTRHFQLFRNRLPHDIAYIDQRMRQHWNQAATRPNREALAHAWFQQRVDRVERNWHSFVKGQQRGRLPEGWNFNHHNIVVFTSSEDEFVAIGDCWSNHLYPDQGQGIQALAAQLLVDRPDARLTVRMHPNLIGIDNASCRRMRNMQSPNLRIIPPESKIDSYELLRVADTVASFGSSIGIEAVFWDKPSVLMGPCFYQHLQGPVRASDHNQAVHLLSQDLMPAVDHEALIYGYWQSTHGIPFQYFEPHEDLFTGTFKGQQIYPQPPGGSRPRWQRKLARIKQRWWPDRDRSAA